MKLWMKALIWAGLGGGIGFFAGYQVGAHTNGRKRASKTAESHGDRSYGGYNELKDEGALEYRDVKEAINRTFAVYRGEDTDGDEAVIDSLPDGWENDPLPIGEPAEAEVETAPADIPQLHPQDLLPFPITAEEFEQNEQGYEQKLLDYYEGDDVLYDPEQSDIIPVPDEVLGIGALLGFGGDPNNPAETIYIQNDTAGTLYQVELVHGRFNDMIVGTIPPDDEADEEEEDLW